MTYCKPIVLRIDIHKLLPGCAEAASAAMPRCVDHQTTHASCQIVSPSALHHRFEETGSLLPSVRRGCFAGCWCEHSTLEYILWLGWVGGWALAEAKRHMTVLDDTATKATLSHDSAAAVCALCRNCYGRRLNASDHLPGFHEHALMRVSL